MLYPLVEVDFVCPGQIFRESDHKITTEKCWMIFCHDESCSEGGECCCGGRYFAFPLLPTKQERAQAVKDCFEQSYDIEFLTRCNEVFNVAETKLDTFLAQMPDFQPNSSLKTILEMIRDSCDALYENSDSIGEPYVRHLYLAVAPVTYDRKPRVTFLEFDDGVYRPEVRYFPAQRARYVDLLETLRGWKRLNDGSVEDLFQGVDDQTIDTLNSGLQGLKRIEQTAIGHDKTAKYRIMDHIVELNIVPSVWFSVRGKINFHYDAWADWQTDDEGIFADIAGVRLRHQPDRQRADSIQLSPSNDMNALPEK